ncbi:MAG: beta-ketoacyl synthase [Pirellulales bacterium]
MNSHQEAVITGVGVVSPIGIGRDVFWRSLVEGQSGVRPLSEIKAPEMPVWIGGEVRDFDPKDRINRKSLKVMSRDIQMAVVAAALAADDAKLSAGAADPERMGVTFSSDLIQAPPVEMEQAYRRCMADGPFDFSKWASAAQSEIYPLWFLKHLPNMPACHIAILHDLRGPNNTITVGETSCLAALAEGVRYIQRGSADVVFCGGVGSNVRTTPFCRSFLSQVSLRNHDPTAACRPFDADRDGQVNGEGAAVFVVESRASAQARGANILCSVLGYGCAQDTRWTSPPRTGQVIERSIRVALKDAGRQPADVGHVNANGVATISDDAMEATAIAAVLNDVPVTAPKSFFGNLGSGSGAVELAASVLGLAHKSVPFTLNYERPDPACPVNVVRSRPMTGAKPLAVVLNQSRTGQAAALVIEGS